MELSAFQTVMVLTNNGEIFFQFVFFEHYLQKACSLVCLCSPVPIQVVCQMYNGFPNSPLSYINYGVPGDSTLVSE